MKTRLFFALATAMFATCVCFGAERVRFVEEKERQCYDANGRQLLDANGRPTCIITTKLVPVVESVSVSTTFATVRNDACPCGCGNANCDCNGACGRPGCTCAGTSAVRFENPGAVEFLTQPLAYNVTSFEDAPVIGIRVRLLPRVFPNAPIRTFLASFRENRPRLFNGRFLANRLLFSYRR